MRRLLALPFAGLFLAACIGDLDCEYHTLRLPAQPLHLKALSSPYDDWNCGDPEDRWMGKNILFSSNRATSGGTFDFVPMGFELRGEGDVRLEVTTPSPMVTRLAATVRTDADELGPTFLFKADQSASSALVFSRGYPGDHDLRVLLPDNPNFNDWDTSFLPIRTLTPLNSPSDEGYLTWDHGWDRVFFHSDRDGRYRLWQAKVPMTSSGPFAWLREPTADSVEVRPVPGLAAADGEERCPFLKGDTLFFVSNRSGGQGGFDIYRSAWKDGAWGAPENLGPAVNSPQDEYRPHPIDLGKAGPALIFSSNRTGGLGGYDLYLAGLR